MPPVMTAVSNGEARFIELIRQFPLRHIEDEASLDKAIAMINSLVRLPELSPEEQDYRNLLAGLIHDFESVAYPIGRTEPGEMLKFLIESKGVTQAKTADATGIAESTISEILAGRRQVSKTSMKALGIYFNVDPAIFL